VDLKAICLWSNASPLYVCCTIHASLVTVGIFMEQFRLCRCHHNYFKFVALVYYIFVSVPVCFHCASRYDDGLCLPSIEVALKWETGWENRPESSMSIVGEKFKEENWFKLSC
jgi:hypothetical protein